MHCISFACMHCAYISAASQEASRAAVQPAQPALEQLQPFEPPQGTSMPDAPAVKPPAAESEVKEGGSAFSLLVRPCSHPAYAPRLTHLRVVFNHARRAATEGTEPQPCCVAMLLDTMTMLQQTYCALDALVHV